jgi:hypothetical protein
MKKQYNSCGYKLKIKNKLSIADIAWSAGLFDGEGSVGIYGFGKKHTDMQLIVQFGMTDLKPLKKLSTMYGGYARKVKHRKNKSQVYQWVIYGKTALNMLKQIFPYTIIKKAQIKSTMEYPVGISAYHVGKKVMKKRFQIALKLRKLKRKHV